MATGACEKYGADYGLSATGFAGPTGGTQVLPVGTIYIGYSSPISVGKTSPSWRPCIQQETAATAALDWMRRKLKNINWKQFWLQIQEPFKHTIE